VRTSIEKRYQSSVHDNATFYITTQGVLGEQFMAIDPGSPDRPTLEDGAYVRGLDPPRLDRLIAESYDLLHTAVALLREHKPELRETFSGLSKTLKGTGKFFEQNTDRLDKIAANVEKMTEEGAVTVESARKKYVDNPQIDRILNNVDNLSAATARDVPVLMAQGKETLGGAQKVVGTLAKDEQLAKLQAMLDDLSATTKSARVAAQDAQVIAAHIRQGRGSVGALVMDEQLFDDLQELARDLKHNPWKFFWKE
jgi:phospholipid/cholesterol/gamma-HCH transport system substrate-binding protein